VGEEVAAAVLAVLLAALGVVLVRREGARLRRASRRYRELELEGIEELRSRGDMLYPEQRIVDGGWMREPDGGRADADRVLHDELEQARRYTRGLRTARSRARSISRGKEVACLL
jgi:hypothetical protein